MAWDKKRPERFALEKRLLGQFHPGVKLIKKGGKWRIIKRYQGRKGTYEAELVYPRNFPYGQVKAYLIRPRAKRSAPHYFANSRWLCLNEPEDVGVETTGKVYVDWFVKWVKKYERWLETGRW
ncbi:MAG: hypothetical protein ACP5HU_08750 [Phycisphaerae bacterium]